MFLCPCCAVDLFCRLRRIRIEEGMFDGFYRRMPTRLIRRVKNSTEDTREITADQDDIILRCFVSGEMFVCE